MTTEYSHRLTIAFPDGTFYYLHDGHQTGVATNTIYSSFNHSTPVEVTFPGIITTSVDVTRTIEENTLTVEILLEDSIFPKLRTYLTSPTALSATHFKYDILGAGSIRPVLYGKASDIKLSEQSITLTLYSYSSLLGAAKTFRLSRSCRNALYSPECGVNPVNPLYQDAKVISAISTDRLSFNISVPTATSYTNGFAVFFQAGDDLIFDIAASGTNTIYLFERLPTFITIGGSVTLRLGCNKTEENCRFFNNFARFGGAPSSAGFLKGTMEFMASTKSER